MIVIYLILLMISGLFYIMYTGDFSFYLMIFLISLPVVLFVIDFHISRRLKVHFFQSFNKVVGRSVVPLQVIVENPTIFPVANLEILIEHHSVIEKKREKNYAKINLPLLPKETQTLRLNIASLHLGTINMRIKKCRIYDFLRLFKFKLRGKAYSDSLKETTILVYPPYIPLDNLVADYSTFGFDSDEFSPDKKGDDPSQIFDIHEYVEGDKINRIHWKLTAKQDNIMVKDYSLSMTYAVSVFVNLNIDNAKVYDTILESAMSVSMMFTDRSIAHSVEWFDNQQQSLRTFNIKTESDHYECVDALIRTATYSDAVNKIFSNVESAGNQIDCGHYIVISNPLSDADIEKITQFRHATRYLFAFAVSDYNEQNQSISPQDNVSIIYISKDHIGDALSDIVF